MKLNIMKLNRKYTGLALMLFISSVLFAKGPEYKNGQPKVDDRNQTVAGCAPSSRIVYLEFNNVRTRIETGGLWWQDRPNGVADYEVPKGSGSHAIYAGGLWMAGTDVNGQLKAAASLFGNGGVDYWTGPLDTKGTAEINDVTCLEYDRFFELTRAEVAEFVLYNNALADGTDKEKFPDGYTTPQSIIDWPGNGDPSQFQAPKLAPFVDVNADNFYDPDDGDYPYYDLAGEVDCRAPRADRSESSSRPLFGDKTFWWIFNDKGDLHTETNAPSIGMEIHAQAFAFATNDEINDMTFYNFELINRSTFSLTDTYFASYVDPDVGSSADDYVGCDVVRGLGYAYNGDEDDEDRNGVTGYGSHPAAMGIDFFEGPTQDADGIDNKVGIGENEALNGLGYGDSIADNERFGMRRFVYYNIGAGANGDPVLAIHYYNYMQGIWQNGQAMSHGGNGLNSAGVEGIPTAFMFPGDSDPLNWGTNGAAVNNTNWTEDNPGNGQAAIPPGDRRFLQSAGPFTLDPGNVNDITVGVVWAQSESGGRLASLEKLVAADDKAQALFDNCFKVLNGPDAPDLTIQELDQELILYLSNGDLSNNKNEQYRESDPNIVTPDSLLERNPPVIFDDTFRFQGYMIYQLADKDISVTQLDDENVARLAFQCDIVDNVTSITNFTFDDDIQANIPETKVIGQNEGVSHSFRVTEDLFASGDRRLINYKTYYFIAVAYGYNNYKTYLQDVPPNPTNPRAGASDGQKKPYIGSRRNSSGGSIVSISAIPRTTVASNGGTIVNSNYGDLIGITRWQGTGNGNNAVELTDATIDRLMEQKAWENENVYPEKLDYELGSGPLTVKVVDPLNVIDGSFVFKMLDDDINGTPAITDDAEWILYRKGANGENDTVKSQQSIKVKTEQLLFSPNWGLSIEVGQGTSPGLVVDNVPLHVTNGYLGSNLTFDDPTKPWLFGIPDRDVQGTQDWIQSGRTGGVEGEYGDRLNEFGDFADPNGDFEGIGGGVLSPFNLVGFGTGTNTNVLLNKPGFSGEAVKKSKLQFLSSFTMVFTKDKTKWTRCPVIEQQERSSRSASSDAKFEIRRMGSVDKDGNQWQPGMATDVTDPDNVAYIDSMGMGWFPGYAINMETGERLNMAFGEDSWFGNENGADMIWNPTSNFISGGSGSTDFVWGGKHVVYVFRKTELIEGFIANAPQFNMPEYDGGAKLIRLLRNKQVRAFGWGACSWVLMPMLLPGQELLSNDVRINVQVTKPFNVQYSDLYDTTMVNGNIMVDSSLQNSGRPVYTFETSGFAVEKGNETALKDEIKTINIVPNPYYAISEYEESALENEVKLINLPENCTIKIYNMAGTLVRSFSKSDPLNYLDWDLKNQAGIPIASGVYIIHIDVPNVGEKILKWFGIMRPVDLNNF